MLRVAILETEEIAKDMIFELASQLEKQEWSFQYFTKISQFAKAEQAREFQIIIFHEKFEVPRVTRSFVLNKPQRVIIYSKTELTEAEKTILPFARIFYIQRKDVKSEFRRILSHIELLLKNQEEYLFSYGNIQIPLKISDICYIEKQNKYLIYHTMRGEFHDRKSMRETFERFEKFHFLWIHSSYLVNLQYVTRIDANFIILKDVKLPIARGRKSEIIDKIRSYLK